MGSTALTIHGCLARPPILQSSLHHKESIAHRFDRFLLKVFDDHTSLAAFPQSQGSLIVSTEKVVHIFVVDFNEGSFAVEDRFAIALCREESHGRK